MVQLVWVKSFYNAVVFIVSLAALSFALKFVSQTDKILLPEAPKATQDLQKVFLPPIFRVQWFVFAFDSLVMLYYIYQWPVWDCIKSKFPFFQYEAKTSEKADCTNLLLTIMFDLISKVSDPTLSSNSFFSRRDSLSASSSPQATCPSKTSRRCSRSTRKRRETQANCRNFKTRRILSRWHASLTLCLQV